jgi:hypothetical protein
VVARSSTAPAMNSCDGLHTCRLRIQFLDLLSTPPVIPAHVRYNRNLTCHIGYWKRIND